MKKEKIGVMDLRDREDNMAIQKISFNDRTNWLALRRKAVGGSDAASILGLSKWSSPLSVYCDKLGLTPEREDNEAMRQGRDLEEYVAQRWMEETGLKVRRENHILINTERPFMHANIDRRIVGVNEGLECKTTSVYNDTDFEGGDIQPEYYVQCQHYMAVTGWPVWHLAVLVLNKGFYIFRVERNEEDIAVLIETEKNFWEENVLKQVPPEPKENDSSTLTKMFSNENGGYVPLHHLSSTIKTLIEKKDQVKNLGDEISTLENEIKLTLGEASEGSDGNFDIAWKTRTTNRFDSSSFKKENKDLYNQFTKESSSRYFTIKASKEA